MWELRLQSDGQRFLSGRFLTAVSIGFEAIPRHDPSHRPPLGDRVPSTCVAAPAAYLRLNAHNKQNMAGYDNPWDYVAEGYVLGGRGLVSGKSSDFQLFRLYGKLSRPTRGCPRLYGVSLVQ